MPEQSLASGGTGEPTSVVQRLSCHGAGPVLNRYSNESSQLGDDLTLRETTGDRRGAVLLRVLLRQTVYP